ncbi:MAG: cyclic pyranopterin monophosphate synthase MoaC [Rhodospirillaceae bacterium]|nr:cyclic pyranopterin monophosphate synthase MoaC [Rhodospirillaceae bacterium]
MADPAQGFTHLDAQGAARMVDVGGKEITKRRAVARGSIRMAASTLEKIEASTIAKGDVLATARLAGIMAAKRTAELIPLCHPLPITSISVDLAPDRENAALEIAATVACTGRTGVEMEALTAVSIAALAVYDMCKAIDRGMEIGDIRLEEKSGGRSGDWSRSSPGSS